MRACQGCGATAAGVGVVACLWVLAKVRACWRDLLAKLARRRHGSSRPSAGALPPVRRSRQPDLPAARMLLGSSRARVTAGCARP